MPATLRGEAGDDDVWPERADDAYDVREDDLAVPNSEGLLGVFGKPEVNCPGEELAATIQPTCGEEFLGAENAQLLAKFGAEDILAAVSAGDREIGGTITTAPSEIGNELGILIIRVSGNIEDGAHFPEAAQVLQNRCARHRVGVNG